MIYIGCGRSATGYEGQVGHIVIRWCTLSGAHWAWRPWRRLTIRWHRDT